MTSREALLWRLDLNSSEPVTEPKYSYLFGTMHSAAFDAVDKASRVYEFIDQCTHYYGETDLDNPLLSQSQSKEIREWDGLKNNINPSSYRKIRNILKLKSGIDLDHIQSMPPLILQTYISENLMSGQSFQPPLDMLLWTYARQINKEVGGIESAEDQERIYRKIPLKFQNKQLKDALLHISRTTRHLHKLTTAYYRGDLTRLYKLSKPSLGPIKSLLLTDRNKKMADKIYEILHMDQTSFIAVGAAHLPGLKGILRMLKKQGVRLKSIPI
ncbi:MAG: TraB/GumN family protein [Saprospiraceae bacterium]